VWYNAGMKKSKQLKVFTNWDDLPEKAKEDIDDCEMALMVNEIEDLEENTEKEKMFKSMQIHRLQKIIKQANKN
jgi:hypothetical protein